MISVHLVDFPESALLPEDFALTEIMDKVQEICATAFSLRSKHNIRIRQPLNLLEIYADPTNSKGLEDFFEMIKEEVNIKNIKISGISTDEIKTQIMLDFKKIALHAKEDMKKIIAAHKQGQWEEIEDGINIANHFIPENEYQKILTPKGEKKISASTNDGKILVALDIKLDDHLIQEGYLRDMIRAVQNARKDQDLEITQKINIYLQDSDIVRKILENSEFLDFLKSQTLAEEIIFMPQTESDFTDFEIENEKLQFSIKTL